MRATQVRISTGRSGYLEASVISPNQLVELVGQYDEAEPIRVIATEHDLDRLRLGDSSRQPLDCSRDSHVGLELATAASMFGRLLSGLPSDLCGAPAGSFSFRY